MKGSNEKSIKEALNQWLQSKKLNQKYNEARIVDSWAELMGPTISNNTEKVYIRNKVLYLKITSAALRHELHMSKRKIIDLFNEKIGDETILDVRLQ